MKEEIAATVVFLTMLVKKHEKLSRQKTETFAAKLTTILFEKFKSHWYPETPIKGQAYRCIRINQHQAIDSVLEQACAASDVDYNDLGLPKEMTIWVDPFDVCCRYGEKNDPFTIANFVRKEERNVSNRISSAVEKATSDYHSGTSSDDEASNKKTIPTVSNPNSVYQSTDYSQPIPTWSHLPRRKNYSNEVYHQQPSKYYPQHKPFRPYRPSAAFSGPRVDKYHWVNTKR
ncbi:protein BTG4 isoform X2 [Bombina bombina]|uniref:protein BTG4 isoform X2 n=1 Tax=Bombina bombina TaxID=8345 RepID=UPI00235A7301|nr:protein BTG4 isoform X2 [Bombina bombina]